MRRLAIALVACLLSTAAASSVVQAAPPSYLVLRRASAPGPDNQPGKPAAHLEPLPATGYAYGWFGAAPRQHASRHFGFYRTYTQWSKQ